MGGMVTSTYRDSAGRRLIDYPRPSVAVDTAVLTVDGDELVVLEVYRDDAGAWALPGTFLHEAERLRDAVLRSLRDKVGLAEYQLAGVSIEQLRVFDEPRRDPRGWVLSATHVAVLRRDLLDATSSAGVNRLRLQPVDAAGDLAFDHPAIVAAAAEQVRRRYAAHPDPDGLLEEPFTIRELYDLHMAVAPRTGPGQARPSIDTFRRYMTRDGLIEDTKLTTADRKAERAATLGAPARLYRRAGGPPDLIDVLGVRPVRPERARTERRRLEAGGLAGQLAAEGVVPAIVDVVVELAERTPIVAAARPNYVALHPAEGKLVAVYVHKRRFSVPLDPSDAQAFADEEPTVRVQPVSTRTSHAHVSAEALADPAVRRRTVAWLERAVHRAQA